MFRYLTVAIVGFVVTASSVFAGDQLIAHAMSDAFSAVAGAPLDQPADDETPRTGQPEIRRPQRPWPLPALYGSSVFLQSYDAYLTLSALENGAREMNPILSPLSNDPVALIAVKAGLTAASFVGAERLWRDNHRASAVALMVLSNAMMVIVAAHNNAVLQRLK